MQTSFHSLSDILTLDQATYNAILNTIFSNKGDEQNLKLLLDKVHTFLLQKRSGWKTVKYLLYHLNNSVLKKQLLPKNSSNEKGIFSLRLKKGIYPFEKNPFSSFLIDHQPKLSDLSNLFSVNNNKGDYLARVIFDASNEKGILYLPKKEFINENDEKELTKYNNGFTNSKREDRCIEFDENVVFLKSNEINTSSIISNIKERSNKDGFENYSKYINNRLLEKSQCFDDIEKKEAIKKAFDKKSVFAVYGPAGSGKTYFANLLIDMLPDFKIRCIAATNPAVDNLRHKIGPEKAEYMTIEKYLKHASLGEADLLIIDECSAISSMDMNKILQKSNESLLLLLGDTYQIHSIKFGNWFSLLPYFLKKDAYIYLDKQFRSQSEILQTIWSATRNINNNLQGLLDTNKISQALNDSIFKRDSDDEIILCLNYDGLYGINNINKVIQSKNQNKMLRWKQYIFKVGDPILFLDSPRFEGIFHNNQKGKIIDVSDDDFALYFKMEVFSEIPEIVLSLTDAIENYEKKEKSTIIGFSVRKSSEEEYDNDSQSDAILPFQIAYAVSIHKAQGLEYDSVKIVISNEVEEQISHNIFYTAITRAKKYLRIFWSIESEAKIIQSFKQYNCKNDANELRKRFPALRPSN